MPCLGPRPKFDVEYGNNKVRVNDDWRMKIVYLGYPGLRNMERVAMKIKDGKYQLLYLAVPDLPFEHWYKVLGDLDAEGWYGHEPKDEDSEPSSRRPEPESFDELNTSESEWLASLEKLWAAKMAITAQKLCQNKVFLAHFGCFLKLVKDLASNPFRISTNPKFDPKSMR
eukprot:jgi/Bigna1/91252/estExt_fgenesh1_pg.C_940032